MPMKHIDHLQKENVVHAACVHDYHFSARLSHLDTTWVFMALLGQNKWTVSENVNLGREGKSHYLASIDGHWSEGRQTYFARH